MKNFPSQKTASVLKDDRFLAEIIITLTIKLIALNYQKNKRRKEMKRALSLILAFLTVVMLIPFGAFSAFAADSADVQEQNESDRLPSSEVLSQYYNTDSSYWTPIYKQSGISSLYGRTSRSYHRFTPSYSTSTSYIEIDPSANGTVPVSETGDILHLSYREDCTGAWGSSPTNVFMTNAGIRYSSSKAKTEIFQKNMAGLDVVVDFSLCLNSSSGTSGGMGIFVSSEQSTTATNDDQAVVQLYGITYDGTDFIIHRNNNSGEALAKLPADEYVNITILFDVGGEDKATCGNEIYLFVNGELKACTDFLTDTQLGYVYTAQNEYNTADGTSYPLGWCFQSFNIRSGAVFGDLKGLNAYYYDDTPDDGDLTNAKRGKNTVGLAFSSSDRYDVVKPFASIPYTFEASIYVPSDVSVMPGTIFGNYYADNYGLNFEIRENGRPRITYVERETAYHIKFSSVDVRSSKGEWVHLAIVIDTENAQARCYIDGVLKETVSNNAFAHINPRVMKFPFRLGGDFSNGNTAALKGGSRIKNVTLFDDVRTSAEIASDYKNGVKGNEKGVICAYTFDDINDSGKNVSDISGNGYNIAYECADDWFISDKSAVTDYAYSFALVGDTQCLSYYHPEKMSTLYDWILANKTDKKIAYVMGLGDITEKNSATEWANAKAAISVLDGQIPYSLIRGNHDGSDRLNEYFANHTGFTDNITGYYAEGKVDNTYSVFNAGGVDYLLVNLDYGPDDAMLTWASGVIESYPNHKVIITTHAYLYRDGTTLDMTDMCAPNRGTSVSNAKYNNGDDIWNELVSKHENIFLVVSGHDEYDDIVMTQTYGEKGNLVTQLLIDPQALDAAIEGGVGLVAMLYFSEDFSKITVEYYSTAQQKYFKEKNQFVIDLTEKLKANEELSRPSGSALEAEAAGIDQTAWKTKFELAYYQDYNNVTDITDSALNASAYKYSGYGHFYGSGTYGPISYIPDGNGGYAIKRTNYGSNLEHIVYLGEYRGVIATNQGRNFVFSGDYKLDGTVAAGQFIVFGSYAKKNTSAAQWKAVPVWIDASGKLYATNPDWTTATSSGVVGGCVDIGNNLTYANVKGQYLCTLSDTEFTNVAVQVKDNYFKIYINGVAKTDWLLFMSESAKELYKTSGDGLYTGGEFAITHIVHHYRGKTTTESAVQSYIHDNNILYFGDKYLGAADGYIKLDDKVYLCKDGEIVTNAQTSDGLLTSDESGALKLSGNYISSISDAYTYANGDLVPIDGIYSGIYTVNGNTYYYDMNKVRAVNKTAYDIKDDNSSLTATVTGYSFDKNGVATKLNGYYLYRSYTDGVSKSDKANELINEYDSSVETLLSKAEATDKSGWKTAFELAYFHNYDNVTLTTNSALNSTAYKYTGGYGHEFSGGPVLTVPDGNGGLALKRTNLNGALNHSVFVGAKRSPIVSNQGRNFVYSSDYKLDGPVTAGQFIVFGSYTKFDSEQYKAIPVWIDVNGNLFACNPNWTTASSNGVTGGCVDLSNAMSMTDATKGQYLCTLSDTEFTNVAVQVKDNYFKIYINGVAKTDWLLFMSDSAKEKYKEAGDALYTSGEFALTNVTHFYRNKGVAASDNYVMDNTTVYFGDEYLGAADGFIANNGNIYYAENGEIKANTAIGIFTTDANGIVTYNGESVKSFADYYESVGNDLVYVNGLYSGSYEVNGNTYYYDKDKNRVDITDSDVAINGSTGSTYTDYESALKEANAGETVVVFKDANMGEATVSGGVTLDLNGNTVAAGMITVFGDGKIIDSGNGVGVLKIEKENLIWVAETSETTAIWNEGEQGYVFASVKPQSTMSANENGDGFELIFRPSLNNDTALNEMLLGNGGDAALVKFVVRISGTNGTIKEFVFNDELVKDAYENGLALKIAVRGVSLEKHGEVNISYVIESECGLSCVIDAGSYTPEA